MKRKWVFKLVKKTEFLCLGMLGNHQESSMKKSLGNQDKYTEPSYLIRQSRHIILNRHIWYVNQDIYTEPSYLIRQSRQIYWTVISDTSIKRRWEEIKFKNPGKRVIHVGSFWSLFKFVVTVYLGKEEGKGGEGEERG